MPKMEIDIKINGSGTREEILESLKKLTTRIKNDNGEMEKYLKCGIKSTCADGVLTAVLTENVGV